MVLGAAAEMLTIGAVLPFLALISGPEAMQRVPAIGYAFDLLGWRPGDDLILEATLLLVAVAAVTALLRLALTWISQKFIFRLGHEIGVEIYARMLRQPYSELVQRNSSEVIAGVEKVQTAIFSVLLPLMQGGVAFFMAIFIIAALIAVDPVIATLTAAGMAVAYLAVSFAAKRMLRHNSEIINSLHTGRIKLVQEGLGGIRDILIDQSQPIFEENFRRLDHQLRTAQTINVFVSQAPRFVVESAGIVLIALLAGYMSTLPGGVVAAIPVLGALALGAQRLLPLLQLVYSGWSMFAGSTDLLIEVVRLMMAPVIQARPRDRSKPPRPFQKDIHFDRVTFAYAGSSVPAVRDIELHVTKGERIGLLGSTGSGKSTLLDLLMGLLEPSSGDLRIDGRKLDDETRADWQGQIAHVPQAIYLTDSSIASNIAFGEPSAAIDMERVRRAAKQAQIDSFICSLPQGYDTDVGERGVRLSGGQRQRIGIARALYKKASVLIFDEATSALDDRTEAAVMDALADIGRDLTIFMIAHRLSTLAGCDRLVRLEAGRIVALGTFDELVGSQSGGRAVSNG